MTLASKITLVRIAFIPLYMVFMYLGGGVPGLWMWLALAVFILAIGLLAFLGIHRPAKTRRIIAAVLAVLLLCGSVAIATNPFELFLDYGNQIKARSLAEQTFLIQLANGCDGYLPTAKAEAGGHYSAFLSSGQVGHVGGEMLVRQTLDQIRDMCTKLYAANTNIDYYPTNFVVQDGTLYYIDYECNPYSDQWNFENWGSQYWRPESWQDK